MAAWQSLARSRSDINEPGLTHLAALLADWSIVADLGFSDLVLYVPTWSGSGFVAVAQIRPDTVPTRIPFDVVGTFVPRGRLPEVDRAVASGVVVAERSPESPHLPADREAIPVLDPAADPGRGPIAVLARYAGFRQRTLGQLEDAYLTTADDLAGMIAQGTFPHPAEEHPAALTRVGDGFVRLDTGGIVRVASPNAQSAMRALGLSTSLVGANLARTLARLTARPGPVDHDLAGVASGRRPGVVEIEGRSATLVLRGIPLSSGESIGLIRNVTEIRQRERALMSKDATIREIHHRVKNNLQTVAALLRLQSRRVPDGVAMEALTDAVQRVNAIALVHESLSHSGGDVVAFDEVVDRIMSVAADTARVHAGSVGTPVLARSGRFGMLPADVSTSLAMCLNELLLNAAEHARATRIEVTAQRSEASVGMVVRDDGVGISQQPGGAAGASTGLGLPIVETLVRDQLNGSLTWFDDETGTAARIDVPLTASPTGEPKAQGDRV